MMGIIARNLASNYFLSFFGMALGFFLVPFLVRKLGHEAFGITVLAESVVMLSEIVTVSVRMALSRYATVALSQDKPGDLARVLAGGKRILNVSSLIVAVAGFSVAFFFPGLFRVSQAFSNDSRVLFALIVTGVLLSIGNIPYWAGVYAKQRFDLINFASSMSLVARAALLFLLFSVLPPSWVSLPLYGGVYVLMILAQNGIVYFAHKRLFPGPRPRFSSYDRAVTRELLSYSVHTTVSRASIFLYTDTANIIINRLWGASLNTVFAVAMKVPTMMQRIFYEPSFVLTPTFTDYIARNDRASVRSLFFMISKVLAILTFPALLALFFWHRAFILAWVGPDFRDTFDLLPLLIFQLFLTIPESVVGSLLNAYGKVKIPSQISLVCGVLNVVLALVLGGYFGLRLWGVVVAAFISGTLISRTASLIYACRVGDLPFGKFIMEIYLKPLFFLMPLAGVFFVYSRDGRGENFDPAWAFGLGAATIGYYLLCYRFVLTAQERRGMKGLLNKEVLS